MKKIVALVMILLMISLVGCASKNGSTNDKSDINKEESGSSENVSGQSSNSLSEADGLRFLDDMNMALKQLKEKYGKTIPWDNGSEVGNDGSIRFEGLPEGTWFQVGWPTDLVPLEGEDVNGDTAICGAATGKFKDAFPFLTAPVTLEQFSTMFNLMLVNKNIFKPEHNLTAYGEVIFAYNEFSVRVFIDKDELILLDEDYTIYKSES